MSSYFSTATKGFECVCWELSHYYVALQLPIEHSTFVSYELSTM